MNQYLAEQVTVPEEQETNAQPRTYAELAEASGSLAEAVRFAGEGEAYPFPFYFAGSDEGDDFHGDWVLAEDTEAEPEENP